MLFSMSPFRRLLNSLQAIYLFAQKKIFKSGPHHSDFQIALPMYWSLDLSGAERFNPEEAIELGSPPIELTTTIWAHTWDADVYRAPSIPPSQGV
jgi:hypothetical protein